MYYLWDGPNDANGSFSLHSRELVWRLEKRQWWSKVMGSAAMYSSMPCFLALSASLPPPAALGSAEFFPVVTGGVGLCACRQDKRASIGDS